MSEDPESHFTITFGQRGRAVKRSGRSPDDGICCSGSVSGRKPSVKDRLGTIVDDSLEERSHPLFKRQRVEQNQGFHRNGSNDTSLGNGDLRLILLQKNLSTQFRDNDPPINIDLRDKLSSKAPLPPADRRRSCSPLDTLGKRKSVLETRDNYDGRLHNMVDHRAYDDERKTMRDPRDNYSLEWRSMRDPRDTYSFERQRMRDPRDTYSFERQRVRDPRDTYSFGRQSMQERFGRQSVQESRDHFDVGMRNVREPRDSNDFGRQSLQEPRNTYDVERQSMRDPRDNFNVERRSMREPRDGYNFEKRTMREPGDCYDVGRRSMQEPRDSYNAGRRSIREPRDTSTTERRSTREPRGSYSVEEQSMPEHRESYSVGRRSIREPKDGFGAERRSIREPRDACIGGKQNMLDSRNGYDYRRMGNVGPGSNMRNDLPAVGHARTPYTLDSLRQRSPDRVFGASSSPERTNLRRRSPDRVFGSSMSPERNNLQWRSPDRELSSSISPERNNLRRRSPNREFSSSTSPERNVEELQRKALIRTYDDGDTSNVCRRTEVSSPQRAARSASLRRQPGSNAVPHLHRISTPVTAQFSQSSRAVPRIPNHVEQPTIDSFLQSLHLEEYSSHFNDEEVDFHALKEMSDTELKELGIPMGSRKRILHALFCLK